VRVAAAGVGAATVVLAVVAGSAETDPPGYEELFAFVVFVFGTSCTLFLLGVSLVVGHPAANTPRWLRPLQWTLLISSASGFGLLLLGLDNLSGDSLVAVFWLSVLVAGAFGASLLAEAMSRDR
jgi:hypothetical protein